MRTTGRPTWPLPCCRFERLWRKAGEGVTEDGDRTSVMAMRDLACNSPVEGEARCSLRRVLVDQGVEHDRCGTKNRRSEEGFIHLSE